MMVLTSDGLVVHARGGSLSQLLLLSFSLTNRGLMRTQTLTASSLNVDCFDNEGGGGSDEKLR